MNHDSGAAIKLNYNPKWLCILKSTNHLQSTGLSESLEFDGIYAPTDEEEREIHEIFKSSGFEIPQNFRPTVQAYDPQAMYTSFELTLPTRVEMLSGLSSSFLK